MPDILHGPMTFYRHCIFIYIYIHIYHETHLNKMSRMSAKLIFRKCCFCEKIVNPKIFRFSLVFVLYQFSLVVLSI